LSNTAQEMGSPQAFEALYRDHRDPWNYAASAYERHKYDMTLRALSQERYRSAFEPACSIGELTALLATRCESLLATDVSPTAVNRARHRCAHLENVQIECQDLRTPPQAQAFDLIVLSEVGYYFGAVTLRSIGRRLAQALLPGGEMLAVHWLGHSRDHVLHGHEVHSILLRDLPLRHIRAERHPGFRIDAWSKS
jgi:cyclopropane fatty-acyl-phospholipid synthase-like methyltransferase